MLWNNGLQDVLLKCGRYGCLFLCYLDIAVEKGTKIDFLDILRIAIHEGLVDCDFTVMDAEKLLNRVTGKEWAVSKIIDKKYAAGKKGGYVITEDITKYIPVKGSAVIKGYGINASVGHWDRDTFHPVIDSNNIKNGHVIELRICREV